MASFNITGPSAGVFTSSVTLPDAANPSVASLSSVVVSSASSIAAVSSGVASASSAFSARIEPSSILPSSSASLSSTSLRLSVPSSVVQPLSSFAASSVLVPISSIVSLSAVPSEFTSAPVLSRSTDKLPLPIPVPSTIEKASPAPSASPGSIAPSSVAPPNTCTPCVVSVHTSLTISRALPNKAIPSVAGANASAVPALTSQTVAGRKSAVAKPGSLTMAASQSSTDAAPSSEGAKITDTASATGSAQASQASSAPTSVTRAGDEPAPPSQTSARPSASPAASTSASSPASTSAAPASSPSAIASASSASHPADTESAAPAPAPAPASSATQANGSSPTPTSVHAVSSLSSPAIKPAPASHDNTQSTPEIPLPHTKADPVVHSTAAASPATPSPISSGDSAGAAAAVPSSEPGPVLTMPAQVKDISRAPAGSTAAAVAASVSPSAVLKPEVDASPAPVQHDPASPTVPVSSDNDSKHATGMVQANEQTAPASGTTVSTITDQPETTLSSPVFVTVTDKNHHTTLSEPPVFTSVIVSQLPDGQFTSYTHVIANPTGIYGVTIDNQKGFFANSGLVAGVFLVVGVVAASIAVGVCLFIRRRRRPRFIDTISRPLPMPENPFEDPRPVSPPEMHYRSSFTDSTILITRPARGSGDTRRPNQSPFDERGHRRSNSGESSGGRSAGRYNGLGLAGVGAHGRSTSMGSTNEVHAARSRHQSGQSGVVGLAITSDQRIDGTSPRTPREATSASARSSPSIYPPTLPSLRNEDIGLGELVDVPLGRSGSAGSTPSIHSVTRKPVPTPEPEPDPPRPQPEGVVAPTPLPPTQQTTTPTRPPIVPPRSPLRRISLPTPTQPLSPPPYKRADAGLTPSPPPAPQRATRDALTLEMESIVLKAFEPLTPPTSLSSLSPAGSSAGHDASPTFSSSPASDERGSPFGERERQLVRTGPPGIPPGQGWGLPLSPRKETFYTRRSGSQVRARRSVIAGDEDGGGRG
ncbi:hypothetical protein BC628DRAFT_1419444 [Trametes gibbosa]|nr:hypothetical protein BC628DRAFT_1419444 [Trametes gibbosa]